jgi:hypothetical protein
VAVAVAAADSATAVAAAASVAGKRSFPARASRLVQGLQHTGEKTLAKAPAQTETFLELPFKVDSISRTAAPAGAEGVWHCYIISQGTNTITGVRAGTHAEVTLLLDDMIERLNERRAGKRRYR